MRVARAHVLEYRRALDGRAWNPASRWSERRAPILVLESSDGVRACAEAWSRQDEIGRVLEAIATAVEAHVIGRAFDADAVERLHDALPCEDWVTAAARSAIDMALLDLVARTERVAAPPVTARNDPAATAAARDRVRVYGSGGLYRDGKDAWDLVCEIFRYRDEGFRDLKIKVGGLPLAADIERIRAAREAMFPDGTLWVDAVNQLDAGNAVDVASAYRDAGADAIQAPVPFADTVSMARLADAGIGVIAGEATHDVAEFERLLDRARLSLLQVNLGLCGGYTGARRLAEKAALRGVPLTVQAHGTAILLASSLRFGAAVGAHSVEWHRFHDHLHALLGMPGALIVGGQASVDRLPWIDLPSDPSARIEHDAGGLTSFASLFAQR